MTGKLILCLSGIFAFAYLCYTIFAKSPEKVVSEPPNWISEKMRWISGLFSWPRRYHIKDFRICFHFIFLKGAGLPGNRLQKIISRKNVCTFRIPDEFPKFLPFWKPSFSLVFLHNQFDSNQPNAVRHQGVAFYFAKASTLFFCCEFPLRAY